MSFYLKLTKVEFIPFNDTSPNDLRKDYTYYETVSDFYDNTNLNKTFKNDYSDIHYDTSTTTFNDDDLGSNFAVHSIANLDNFTGGDTNSARCDINDFQYDITSDGRILGDIIPYLLDPDNEGHLRFGNFKLYFDNGNHLDFGLNTSSFNADLKDADNPCIQLSNMYFRNSSGSTLVRYSRQHFLQLLGNVGGGNTFSIIQSFFPFVLSPNYASITDVDGLVSTLNEITQDYDGTSSTTPISVFAPCYFYWVCNDKNKLFQSILPTYPKTLAGILRASIPEADNKPTYLNTFTRGSQYLIQEILENGEEQTDMDYYVKYLAYNCFITNRSDHTWGLDFSEFFDGMTSSTTPSGDNPFGEDSTIGGGGGNFDNTSEDIEFPSLPSLSAVSTGFTSLYNPLNSDLNNLADKMWDSGLLEQIKQLWQNPMDAIIGLNITFAPIPATTTQNVKLGTYDTGITMPKLQSQYSILDCGTINVNEYWGNFLDYTQTSCYIYLPFIGIEELAIKDVMNATVHVQYHCDVLSGACVAFVKCTKEELNSVIYSYSGNCNTPVPMSRLDVSAFYTGAFNTTMNGVSSVINQIGSLGKMGGSLAIGDMKTLEKDMSNANPWGEIVNSAKDIGNFIMSPKASVQRSGSIGGSSGLLGIKYPFLILTRPKQQKPANYQSYYGLTSHITKKLGECIGFTKIANIHLDGVTATDQEKDMIMSALTSGVFL